MSMLGNYMRLKREQLEEALENPDILPDLLFSEENGDNTLYIDKSWHGIHFLLTGTPWEGDPPLSYVILGGQSLGDQDLGYGPPKYITPEQVKEAYWVLSMLSFDELRKSYNPDRFSEAGAYPNVWDEEGEELDYLLSYLNEIITFFKLASENGEAIIFWVE
ncbi:MAG: hypothetical protein VR68_04000 [Peptococcaceae bacterium BRH_c4a]|nr:MAG: hypothetical protein VR68_04000 [Peptococcaceae bacterium BRH_c4a]